MLRTGLFSKCSPPSQTVGLLQLCHFQVRNLHAIVNSTSDSKLFARNNKTTKNSHLQHKYFSVTTAIRTNAITPNISVVVVDETVETTLASLGLGDYFTPTGLLQITLECLHTSCGLPWWATIVVSTLIVRLSVLPITAMTQRNMESMRNLSGELKNYQQKVREAGDDAVQHDQAVRESKMLLKVNGLSPLRSMLVPLLQVPVFITYYIGIQQMVKAPIESMRTGGILWFTDLTLPDAYYFLPLTSCAICALTLYFNSTPTSTSPTQALGGNNKYGEYFMKASPILMFPFIQGFPAAIVIYWTTSNLFTLMQNSILTHPKVKTFFNSSQNGVKRFDNRGKNANLLKFGVRVVRDKSSQR